VPKLNSPSEDNLIPLEDLASTYNTSKGDNTDDFRPSYPNSQGDTNTNPNNNSYYI
jgi:hypothetical protein